MKNIGIIGCGLRASAYLQNIKAGRGKRWRIHAMADPSEKAISVFRRAYAQPDTQVFPDGPALLKAVGDELDVLLITSPNATHLASLVPALQHKKLSVVLEKPVVTTVNDCRTAWAAYQQAGSPPLTVGFVLRWTPFYGKIRERIDAGAVGRVLTIEADEMLDPALTSVYMRGWRRLEKNSGPLILEKCSHDMDLLNWFAGSTARRICSFGLRNRFVPNPEAAQHCADCKLTDTCRYTPEHLKERFLTAPADVLEAIGELIPWANDLCVFNSDKDVIDHQVVNVEYDNGVLATFNLCCDQPYNSRTIRIGGTDGQIYGAIESNQIVVTDSPLVSVSQPPREVIHLKPAGSGHHGGDARLGEDVDAMLDGKVAQLARVGLREGIDACLLALGAEVSRRENRVVDMAGLRKSVFGGDEKKS